MENEVTGQSEDLLCPLCLEELDLTDRSFRPCKCGYQICLWCWYNINEKVNGKCPACRTPYSQEQVMQKSLDAEIVKAAREEKKRKKEKQKQKMEKTSIKAAFSTTSAATNALESVEMEKDLQNVRIMQRNLVYIVGLAPNITKEEVLKRKEYLGKFGKIVKIAVNRKLAQNNPHRPSCSAYVTFKREEDALECISALNGHTLDGRLIKATFGTTKYCSFFLRGISCNNPNCLYLHELAKEEDCFTKEDLSMAEKLDPFTSLHSSLDPAQMDLARQGAMEEFSSKLDQNSAGSVESQNPNSDGYDTQSSTKDERAIKNVIERSSLFSLDLAAVFSVKNPENSSFISLQGLPKSLSSSALDRFTDQSRPTISLELPGLSAFGVGRSSSLGWTPAKENSPSESVTKLCLKLPSQIEQTAPLRQVAESHFTSSQEPTEGPPPGLVMNSHLQQSSTAKIFPADKMGQINHNHGYAMYRQAVDRFNGFGMRDTPAAAMPTPVDNNYRLKNF